MEILALSLNHRVTPLDVRESIVFSPEEADELLRRVRETLATPEVSMVSTCNRTEIYVLSRDDFETDPERVILDLLAEKRGFEPRDRPRNYAVVRDDEAVRHLFRVAGGLESQILGESQILAQLKEAQEWGREAGTLGRILHRMWERALRVGKRIRTETAIGDGALSASYAALQLARKIFGDLAEKRILVIGMGEIGLLALDNLKGVPVAGLCIMNRTRARAEKLASDHGAEVRDFESLVDALVEADVVISSTSAPGALVSYPEMKQVRARRGGSRPLLIVDLALPRDFDERCGTLDEVFLKNLDDLHDIVHASISDRARELPKAERIVEAEIETFFEWLGALQVEPTILALRERYHEIRERELEDLRATVDEETFERLDQLTRRLVNRLLHVPSENLRRHRGVRDSEFRAVVHELFAQEVPHRKQGGE